MYVFIIYDLLPIFEYIYFFDNKRHYIIILIPNNNYNYITYEQLLYLENGSV